MEANGHFARLGARRPSQALASRKNSILIAVLSAALAAFLIYLFVSHYRKTPAPAAPADVTVFVAKQYIPRGTPQSTVAAEGLLVPKQVPVGQAIAGAITDPSQITGEVSASDISPSQQISSSDFTQGNVTPSSYLTGDERAVAFSLDATHGLTTYLKPGDTVDVMGLRGGKSEMLAQKVSVIANASGDVILRLSDKQALQLTSATGVSSLWLTLRPTVGAKNSVRVGTVEKS